MLLQSIAEGKEVTLEPKTRLEWWLKKIAESGGSGGVSSWNDLTDKPFGKEESLVEILPETTLAVGADEALLDYELNIESGKTYKVKWNGTEYKSEAVILPLNETMTLLAIGNVQDITGEDNGLPFVIVVIGGQTSIVSLNEEETVTLSIVCNDTVIKTIDKEYLPSVAEQLSEVSEVVILPETTLESDSNAVMLPYKLDIEIDKTYKIMWNGTEYICKAGGQMSDGNGVIVLGNQMELTGVDDGIPFCVAWVSDSPNETAVVVMDGSASSGMNVVISIVSESTTYTKLPEEVLPDVDLTLLNNGSSLELENIVFDDNEFKTVLDKLSKGKNITAILKLAYAYAGNIHTKLFTLCNYNYEASYNRVILRFIGGYESESELDLIQIYMCQSNNVARIESVKIGGIIFTNSW